MSRSPLPWIGGLVLVATAGAFGLHLAAGRGAEEAGPREADPPEAERAPALPAVPWSLDFDASFARAKVERKPMLLDFFADWCAPCKELDEITYRDPRVIAAAERFVTLKVDGTEEDAGLYELYDRFGVEGLPTLVFIDSAGTILEEPRALGFVDPDELLEMMAQVR